MSELKILTYLCNFCTHTDENLPELSNLESPPKIEIKKVTCSYKIDPFSLIGALSLESDGILITCCRPFNCQDMPDDYNPVYKIFFVKRLLEKFGINPNRINHESISAETEKFQEIITVYINLVVKIGTMTVEAKKLIQDELTTIKEICNDSDLRKLFRVSRQLVDSGNVYNEKLPEEKYLEQLDKIIEAKIIRKRIVKLLDEKPLTPIDIAKKLSLSPDLAMKHLLALKTRQKIQLKIIDQDAKFTVKRY